MYFASKSLEYFRQCGGEEIGEKIIIPIVCDKERAGEDFIKAKSRNETNFQNKIQSKGQNNHTKQQIREKRKDSYWDIYDIYVHKDILKETHKTFRQSNKTDKWRDGPIDGQTCG